MAKIILGEDPKTFAPATIKFVRPNGEAGEIVVTYKYRTRKQFGALMNDIHGDTGEKAPEKIDFAALFEKALDKNADHLMACVDSWDLDDKVSRETMQTLCDKLPAAAIALMAGYSAACNEGRLGN